MFTGLIARLRVLWRGFRHHDQVETEMREELRQHVEMRADDLARSGLSREEALRQARLEFGSAARYAEEARAPRGLWHVDALRFSWLDVKLGARMLAKYPFVSAVSGLALAIAIAIGTAWFEIAGMRFYPTLPFDDGGRIVRIEAWDAARLAAERPSVRDFLAWRGSLTTIVELGAYRVFERNLVAADGIAEPVRMAEMSVSALALTRVAPELGRPLLPEDEQMASPDVVLIGHDLWERRFFRDPAVVGRTVQVGRTTATVAGVMPEGFGFPFNQEAWSPLRLSGAPSTNAQPLDIVGRLAPGATFESAQAEVGARGLAEPASASRGRLQPRVRPFAGPAPGESPALYVLIGHAAILSILAAVCANVATLVFGRTALRESEIIVRTALGATRGRVIAQLTAEAFVLAGASALAGLALAAAAIKIVWWYDVRFTDAPPAFWLNDSIEPSTVVFAAVLAVIGAVLVALLPALKATGPRLRASLQQLGGGQTTMRFGGVWSAIIVAQVALTVLCLPLAIGISSETLSDYQARATFPGDDYLTFRMELDREAGLGGETEMSDEEYEARLTAVYEEVKRRLAESPGVTGVTFADRLPAMNHPLRIVETQRGSEPPAIHRGNLDGMVAIASVDERFFDTFGVSIVAGRGFQPGDQGAPNLPVIVNESFVRNLEGGSPLGVRVRNVAREGEPPGPWYEIVGVSRNLNMEPTDRGEADFIYRPASPATARPLMVAVRVNGNPGALGPVVSAIARRVDPGLRIYRILPMDEVIWRRFMGMIVLTFLATLVVAIALLLSAAGLFALMAVAVARRSREIAIRLTLGATRRNVLAAVFGRAAVELFLGILAGNLLVVLLLLFADGTVSATAMSAMLAISGLMTLVGLFACIVPVRRALSIQPTEALRLG
ncbi:MAG: ABC transporter permease [Vicinamibacterales bacterium]